MFTGGGVIMPLFSKKKQNIERIKPPTFPGLPEHQFPSYESGFSEQETIKEAVQRPSFLEEKESRAFLPEEKAIFVQIDKYKEAIDTLEIIKEKLKTSQAIINELNELKKQEESELSEWQNNIEEIKEKLNIIDNNLFEV